MLKVFAIVIGALAVVTRGVGLVSPATGRRMISGLVAQKAFFLVLLLVAAVLGAVVIWGARTSLQETVTWQAVVMLVLGIVLALAGLVNLAFGKLMPAVAKWIVALGDGTIRLLCLLGVAIGVFLIWMGTTM
jgi:hypothetical protein